MIMKHKAVVWCMGLQTPVNVALSFGKRQRLKQQRHQFNLTSTYARFSDVPTPYFPGVCRDTAATAQVIAQRRRTSVADRLRSKQRPVAWFASHCSTSGRRERYGEAKGRWKRGTGKRSGVVG